MNVVLVVYENQIDELGNGYFTFYDNGRYSYSKNSPNLHHWKIEKNTLYVRGSHSNWLACEGESDKLLVNMLEAELTLIEILESPPKDRS